MNILLDAGDSVPKALREWPWYGWMISVGVLLGWFFDNARKAKEMAKLNAENAKLRAETDKLKAEVTKLEAEEIKLASDVLEKLQRARDRYAEACASATKSAITLNQALKAGDASGVTTARNAFCETVTSGVIHHFCSLAEWGGLTRKQSPEWLASFISNDVLDELARITDWVRIINLPIFLNEFGSAPLTVSERTLRPILDLSRSLPDEYAGAIKQSLFTASKRLQET